MGSGITPGVGIGSTMGVCNRQHCATWIIKQELRSDKNHNFEFVVAYTTILYYIRTMKYELNNCIGLRLRRLSRIVDGYYRKNLIDYEITEKQLAILFLLSEMKKVEQGRIGKVLKLERSTVSRNIKLLTEKGLIKRTPDYKPEIELTTKGKNLALELIPRWEKTMDELIAKLGDNGMQTIKKLETKLV